MEPYRPGTENRVAPIKRKLDRLPRLERAESSAVLLSLPAKEKDPPLRVSERSHIHSPGLPTEQLRDIARRAY